MHLAQTQRKKLIITDKIEKSLYSVDLESITYDVDKVDAVKIDIAAFESDLEDMRNTWASSCNGLLCFNLGKYLWLYNPSTTERKQVPDFHFGKNIKLGFGYADSIDEYKFVRLRRKIIDVYSLRKNSWTSIQHDLRFRYIIHNRWGFTLNGAIHWGIYNIEFESILAFDLVKEEFKTLPLPSVPEHDYNPFSLGVFGGYLCTSKAEGRDRFQFWIMKEYGVKASWTRILTVNPFNIFSYLQPLCYLKDINIVMLYKYTEFHIPEYEGLVFHNQEYQKLKKIEVNGIQRLDLACPYVESLVSPNYENHFATEGNQLIFPHVI
ncbi:hypothetical protein Dsin_011922 [Dipteronia sinensis]|uniref:F-box associated beta-propeller type 3 domain-containing protein n=1 Tax=Dipteronia sinensis TaxID=43782 RepID=A0AAE0AH61_9ROSI|nr:hypothetical protein Dsin_011922 [Dipteronia sinensis]